MQDAITKKVEGVGVKKPDGSVIYTKARKGVLLATGGYEGDMEMYRQFNGGDRIYNAGSPYVTGDGVKMQMALGAQLWHMDGQTMSCGYFHGIKVPEFETSSTWRTARGWKLRPTAPVTTTRPSPISAST